MTIDDQIRDEKLQYDINREAAKISALSSGKIGKYEYLTGEKILPSNQKQIIEQAKFTYSPLGKAFEKQIKTIEDQWEKQIKAIQNQGQVKTIQKYAYSPLTSKQKEIINKLVVKRLEEISGLDKKVNPDDIIYRYKGFTGDTKFNEFDDTFSLLDKIKDDKTSLADAKSDQAEFKSNLSEIKKGNKRLRSKEQKKVLYNIVILYVMLILNAMLYKTRISVIGFFDDYSSMVSEAKFKATKGAGFKALNKWSKDYQ